jgi:hypothetical protein
MSLAVCYPDHTKASESASKHEREELAVTRLTCNIGTRKSERERKKPRVQVPSNARAEVPKRA